MVRRLLADSKTLAVLEDANRSRMFKTVKMIGKVVC